ncbi:hypothetical protein, partial [Sphingomonas aerolata]|uniref:hypothetical protein n=1 Tax=Sphingomonas aerolata TaxID=185951 RepID=UPI00141B42D5
LAHHRPVSAHLAKIESDRRHHCKADFFNTIAQLQTLADKRKQALMKMPFLLSLLLPRQRTTEAKAREAIIDCGINPDEIAWRVGDDGSLAFGRKHPDADGLTDDQTQRILDWAGRERIKLGFIAWETKPS